jgi:hypothetical protein
MDDMEKKKFLTLPGFELRPLGRPAYTDYAIPAPEFENSEAFNSVIWPFTPLHCLSFVGVEGLHCS